MYNVVIEDSDLSLKFLSNVALIIKKDTGNYPYESACLLNHSATMLAPFTYWALGAATFSLKNAILVDSAHMVPD